jgi:archaeal flagellar protein FlaJ
MPEEEKTDVKDLLKKDNSLDILKKKPEKATVKENSPTESEQKETRSAILSKIADSKKEEKKEKPKEPPKERKSLFSRLKGSPKPKDNRSTFLQSAINAKKMEKQEDITSEALEAEWREKLKKSKDSAFVSTSKEDKEYTKKSIMSVMDELKEKPTIVSKPGKIPEKRLGKIKGSVSGTATEFRERDIAGHQIPGVYKLYAVGEIPPLNIFAKIFYGMKKTQLSASLSALDIPLYPEEYAAFASATGFISGALLLVSMLLLGSFDVIMAIIAFVVGYALVSFFVLSYPSMHSSSSGRGIEKNLPYALRHMSALLSAGISIFDSIVSVSKSDYGPLSKELEQVVWDVKSGESLSDALEESGIRVNSKAYSRVVIHIRRALQMGGDISQIIGQIADDLTFEMRMKISDFVEKLNAFAIVYLIGGIVGPVVIAIFSVVNSLSFFGGGGTDPMMLTLLLLLAFPMMMFVIVYVVKLMEPKV